MLQNMVVVGFLLTLIYHLEDELGKRGYMKAQHIFHQIFFTPTGIEQVAARAPQAFCFTLAGALENLRSTHGGLVSIGSIVILDVWANRMLLLRKFLRFFRLPGLLRSYFATSLRWNSAEELLLLLLGLCGDLVNFIFYATDHYTSFYLIGILGNKETELVMDTWGTWLWLISGVIYAFRGALGVYIHWKEGKANLPMSKEFYALDALRNMLQILVAISFLNVNTFSKKVVGVMAMTISLITIRVL